MRVTTAFNRILRIPGAWVTSVTLIPHGAVVGIRRRQRRLSCPCGFTTRAGYDASMRRWRHLDMASCRLWLEAEIRRVDCPTCGVRTEEVPWARPGARHSRDFEDVVAWLCQRTDKTSTSKLMRCSWEAVHAIVTRVVDEHLDDARLDGLHHLGVDEISYRRGHQYLTIVANHDDGRVVWVAKGRSKAALTSFYDALGAERCQQVRAVSMDMAVIYRDATAAACPQAVICFDPFHVIRWTNEALESVYREESRQHGPVTRQWRQTRYALRAGVERLDAEHVRLLKSLRRSRYHLWRAWDLKERLRLMYRDIAPGEVRDYLKAWCRAATRSRLGPFVRLAQRIRLHFDGIVAAVEWGLSNSRLEGINAKIRLINKRGYGHRSAESLAAMIHLCLGGITINLPTQR